MTVIFGILILLLLIFPHETGHFIAAKACGVEVNEFALGMGPAIFKKQHGETLYSLRAIPSKRNVRFRAQTALYCRPDEDGRYIPTRRA